MSFLSAPDTEQRLVLDAVLDRELEPGRLEAADPGRLFELARRQFVCGVLVGSVLASARGRRRSSAPQIVSDALRQASIDERDRAVDGFLRQMCTYVDVSRSLDDAGAGHLVLKGPTSARLYADEFERHAGDLDVLIDDPGRAESAVSRMIADGWEPSEPWLRWSVVRRRRWIRHRKDLAFRKAGDRTFVELHWRASASRREWPGAKDPFDDLRTVEIGGRPIPALGERDERLYLLHHGTKHGWRRLKWVADMRRLLGDGESMDGLRADPRLDELGLRGASELLEVLLRRLQPSPSNDDAHGVRTRATSDHLEKSSVGRLKLGLVDLGLEELERDDARQMGTMRVVRGKLVRSTAAIVMAPDRRATIRGLTEDFARRLDEDAAVKFRTRRRDAVRNLNCRRTDPKAATECSERRPPECRST